MIDKEKFWFLFQGGRKASSVEWLIWWWPAFQLVRWLPFAAQSKCRTRIELGPPPIHLAKCLKPTHPKQGHIVRGFVARRTISKSAAYALVHKRKDAVSTTGITLNNIISLRSYITAYCESNTMNIIFSFNFHRKFVLTVVIDCLTVDEASFPLMAHSQLRLIVMSKTGHFPSAFSRTSIGIRPPIGSFQFHVLLYNCIYRYIY